MRLIQMLRKIEKKCVVMSIYMFQIKSMHMFRDAHIFK